MSKSICDSCKNDYKNGNEKPCSTCMQWIDGYLDATNYEPKR